MKFITLINIGFISTLALAWTPLSSIAGELASRGGDLPEILSHETTVKTEYLPDFSYAGYGNGTQPLPAPGKTVIEVDLFGAAPNDDVDDSAALLAAIAEANTVDGPVVVRFGAGRYRMTEVVRIERSDIVLQGKGSGEGGTTLWMPRPLMQVDRSDSLDELRRYIRELDKRQREPERNLDEYFSEYSWSGGLIWVQKPGTRPAAYLESFDPEINKLSQVVSGTRGGRILTVTSTNRIKAGDIVQLQWLSQDGPDGGIIHSLYGDAASTAGSHHWSFPKRPLVRQISRVEAVEGNSITLGDPLLHDVNDEIPAHLASWEGLVNVGIEDLHLEFPDAPWFGHHMEQGYNGIYLASAFDSWIRNVRTTNADSGILSYNSANVTLRDITTEGSRRAHYGVHLGNVHNVLVDGLRVMNPVLHSLTFNTQSTKCVYKDAEVFVTPILDQHAGANHQNLFDNVTLHSSASASESGPVAVVFDGSGAGYWQPGHGAYNTTWNLRVLINAGAYPEETVTILGLDEGPMARIVGLHGNRNFELDYRPAPYIEMLNEPVSRVPSLYDYQLDARVSHGDGVTP